VQKLVENPASGGASAKLVVCAVLSSLDGRRLTGG